MKKRKENPENSETLISDEPEEERKSFFACYLLASLSPRHKGHTYIGFTVNPRRRIRQHNGEIGCGAWRTKRKRPWEMVLCIYGFPTHVSALQFEWAWQHPHESLAVRKAAATFKSLSGISNKVKLAYTMLNLPSWHCLNITINYFSTKYMKNSAGCPRLPEHMKVQVTPMDELPCYNTKEYENSIENVDSSFPFDSEKECEEASGIHSRFAQEPFPDASAQKSMDYQTSTDGCASELGEDCGQPFGIIKSTTTRSSPDVTGSSTEVVVHDRDIFTCIGENSVKLKDQGRETITANDFGKLPSSSYVEHSEVEIIDISSPPPEVEIIDILTPPPECRTSSCRNKTRVSSLYHEIIDLTRSPNFVQL